MVSPMELRPDPKLSSRIGSKCLIGKVITQRRIHECDVASSVSADWKCSKGFSVSTVGPNTFLFCFEDDHDLMQVLLNVPWNVKGGLLVMLPWSPNQALKELDFNFSPFWVQVHGLPPSYLTRENGLKIGQSLGKLMYLDMKPEPEPGCGKFPGRTFIRIRVVLDIRRSVLTGRWVRRVGLTDVWVEFRYEKLGRFCYKCGRIGRNFSTCEFPEVNAKFGSWLSVPPCLDSPSLMLIQYSGLIKEEMNDEKNQENDESEDQILCDKEEFSTRSHLKRLVINTLDSVVLIVNSAIIHRLVAAAAASEADSEVTENWRVFLENWKLFVVVIGYFAYLVWRLVRVSRNSWLLNACISGSGQMVSSPGFMLAIIWTLVCFFVLPKFA